MAEIARNSAGEGDVALDFLESPERISIVDPYLAFYLSSGGLSELELPYYAAIVGSGPAPISPGIERRNAWSNTPGQNIVVGDGSIQYNYPGDFNYGRQDEE
jgi:hypothetical protein